MVDVKQWLKDNYENNKSSKVIVVKEGTELKGDLEIKDYPNLETIFLPFTKEITKLTISGCPKIEVISVPRNKITEITGLKDLGQLKELNISGNQLGEIDISNNIALETLFFRGNPTSFKFTGGFKTLKKLLKLVTWNSANTFSIADILLKEEGLSEGDLKELANKLGVKITEGKSKDEIKKDIIAEIEKGNQNKEKLKDPKDGIPDLLNEKGEIDKDKLGKLKNDAKKYQDLVTEPKNDPIKSTDKKDIDQGALTKLIEDSKKFKDLLDKAGIDPTKSDAEKHADDLKKAKEAVDKSGLDPATDAGKQITDLKDKSARLEIIVKEIYGENYGSERWEMKIEIPNK
jgi:hypothetical protein